MKFFPAKTRPENAVGMLGTEVDALFRLRTEREAFPPKPIF
jgi:hypothetical protein